MSRTCFVVFVVICFIFNDASASTNIKFEVILENMTECQDPQPPFSKKRVIIVECNIHQNKGRTYLSGRNTVLNEVPFQNFSISTYRTDAFGRRELMLHVQKLSCRSFISKLFLEYGNFRYVKHNCRLLKGSFAYKDFDIDKVLHGIPNWHQEGRLLHRTGLTFNGKTIFCVEIVVTIKNVD